VTSSQYDKEDADFLSGRVKETFNKMFNSYRLFLGNSGTELSAQSTVGTENSDSTTLENFSFAMEFEKDIIMSESLNKNEVNLYLMETLEKRTKTFDILNWWKVNSSKYPILGQMARDVLAMSVSTVASESSFSTGGRILSQYRSSLTPKTVEALICAQNWFRSSLIATDFEELLEEFEKLELGTSFYFVCYMFVQ